MLTLTNRSGPPIPKIPAIAIALVVLTAIFFLLAIWAGDGRWAATAAVSGVPGFVFAFAAMMFFSDGNYDNYIASRKKDR